MKVHPDCPLHMTEAGPCYCGKTPSKVVAEDSPESNKNPILNWSWEKPTEPGLYLACYGDAETTDSVEQIMIVDHETAAGILNDWTLHSVQDVSKWDRSWKFAKLCVGKEAIDG